MKINIILSCAIAIISSTSFAEKSADYKKGLEIGQSTSCLGRALIGLDAGNAFQYCERSQLCEQIRFVKYADPQKFPSNASDDFIQGYDLGAFVLRERGARNFQSEIADYQRNTKLLNVYETQCFLTE